MNPRNRQYSVTFEKVAVTAAQDLFEIVADTKKEIRLVSLEISQDSDEGDSESEMLNVLIHRGSTAGSGGSSVTPVALNHSATFGGTVKANNTTQSTEGEKLWSKSFNIMAGLDRFFTDMETIRIPSEGRLIIELQDAPADELTMSGTLFFEEEVVK